MGVEMEQINQILRNNLGNRLTEELVIGLNAMITHLVQVQIEQSIEQASVAEPVPERQAAAARAKKDK